MSLLERVRAKLEGTHVDATQIDLSNVSIGSFDEETKDYLETFKKVSVVLFYGCELRDLENFPKWKLTGLELSKNNLTDDCLAKLATITSLVQIILIDNNIQSTDSLVQLKTLKKLDELDFTDNPVAEKENYRRVLFDNIKSLEKVDQRDVNGEVVESEEEEEDESDAEFSEKDDNEGQEDDDYADEGSDQIKKSSPRKQRKQE